MASAPHLANRLVAARPHSAPSLLVDAPNGAKGSGSTGNASPPETPGKAYKAKSPKLSGEWLTDAAYAAFQAGGRDGDTDPSNYEGPGALFEGGWSPHLTCWARTGNQWMISDSGLAYRMPCGSWLCENCARDKKAGAQAAALRGLEALSSDGARIAHLVLTTGGGYSDAAFSPSELRACWRRLLRKLKSPGKKDGGGLPYIGAWFMAIEVAPTSGFLHLHILAELKRPLPMSTKEMSQGFRRQRKGAGPNYQPGPAFWQDGDKPMMLAGFPAMAYAAGFSPITWAGYVREGQGQLLAAAEYVTDSAAHKEYAHAEEIRSLLGAADEVTKGQAPAGCMAAQLIQAYAHDEGRKRVRVRPFEVSQDWPGGQPSAVTEELRIERAKLRQEAEGSEEPGEWRTINNSALTQLLNLIEEGRPRWFVRARALELIERWQNTKHQVSLPLLPESRPAGSAQGRAPPVAA